MLAFATLTLYHEQQKQEFERIARLCEQLESHLIADEEGFALTKELVDIVGDSVKEISNKNPEEEKDEEEEDEEVVRLAKATCFKHHNAESLLQKMFMKMTRIGEDEMAAEVGDAIGQLYQLGKATKTKDATRKKTNATTSSSSSSEDDEDDDERTIELRAVACSQIGAQATQRNPEVQTFGMRKNEGVIVRVHESSWSDAGLAFRIWGAARVAFRVVDFASEYFTEKEKTCLELGSGCGLIGAAIATLGGRCTVTEGAPGALAALRKTADGINDESKNKEPMKVAFLDWRDDLAALDEEKNGTVERMVDIGNASTKSPANTASSSCNFVHANKATFDNAHVTMRLEDDAQFDCVVGSDLIYDRQHCTALAASIARRLKCPNGEAIIFLAVRSEELLLAFSKKCAKRGLSVGVYAPTKPNEDLEDFSEITGGHANRALPETANTYWDLVAEKFSDCLLSRDYSLFAPLQNTTTGPAQSEEEEDVKRDKARRRSDDDDDSIEGRFAMVRCWREENNSTTTTKAAELKKGIPVGDVKSMRVKT